VLTRTGDGESFFVQQLLDAQNAFDVLPDTCAGGCSYWLELRELISQNENVAGRWHRRETFRCEIEFFRNQYIAVTDLGSGRLVVILIFWNAIFRNALGAFVPMAFLARPRLGTTYSKGAF